MKHAKKKKKNPANLSAIAKSGSNQYFHLWVDKWTHLYNGRLFGDKKKPGIKPQDPSEF
jgi:hypothetical protein